MLLCVLVSVTELLICCRQGPPSTNYIHILGMEKLSVVRGFPLFCGQETRSKPLTNMIQGCHY